jgi:hypothetical protein
MEVNNPASGDVGRLCPKSRGCPVKGDLQMSIFDTNEKVEFLARQTLHYDRYAGHQYFLERVEINGKYGLICGEQSDESEMHTKVLLPAVYDEIKVLKISSDKAIYKKFVVFADGIKVALFTLVLNSWVPIHDFNQERDRGCMSHN